jgi:hypothetical protein
MQGSMKPIRSTVPCGRLCRPFNAVMQPAGLSVVLLLVFGASCSRPQANPQPSSQPAAAVAPKNTEAAKVPPPQEDRAEVLLWHLLRRSEKSDAEVLRLQNEVISHDNKCLEEQIATLEGKTHSTYPKSDPAAGTATRVSNLSQMVQGLLNGEEVIEYHNRRHPESPQADVKDLLRQLCGDCTRERAIRDSQLREEAQKYEHSGSKK